jgi:hypothetical protein
MTPGRGICSRPVPSTGRFPNTRLHYWSLREGQATEPNGFQEAIVESPFSNLL